MKYYENLLLLGCFSINDAISIIGSKSATFEILNKYIKKGYVIKIRRNLYSAIDLSDKMPIANRFQIGSSISDSSVISHHSAFEYYGVANQVSYVMSVTSNTNFNNFSFDGYDYVRMTPAISEGVEKIGNKIYITDIERTVLDSINDFDKNMGFEELINCIKLIPVLNEDTIINYLKIYNKCFLFQKVGFIFEHLNYEFGFSDDFFIYCCEKAGNSSRYLMKENISSNYDYSSNWRLTYPKKLWENIEGTNFDVEI